MKFSKWLTSAFAFAVIMPCALLFAACGGTEIEQGPALTAVNDAIQTSNETTSNYSIKTEMKMYMNEEGLKIDMSASGLITVSGEGDSLAVNGEVSATAKVTSSMEGINTTTNTSAKANLTYAKVGDKYYALDINNKLMTEIENTDLIELASFANNIQIIPIDEESLNEEQELPEGQTISIEKSFLQTGDNSYSIKASAVMTSIEQNELDETKEDVTKTYQDFEYEIKDGKITKFVFNLKTVFNDEVVSNMETTNYINYSVKAVSTPTSVEGYETAELTTNLEDIISGFMGM